MSDDAYRYLFPFEQVLRGSRVLIYGAGLLGQEYLRQAKITHYCDVIGFVDKAKERYRAMPVPVYASDEIEGLNFDLVVVALRTDNYLAEIKEILNKAGVNDERIVYVGERPEFLEKTEIEVAYNQVRQVTYAYERSQYSIALYMTGGFGDCVTRKKLTEAIIDLVPEACIDIYYPAAQTFMRPLYRKCCQVNALLDDAGALYKRNIAKYALGMMVETFLQVDEFKPEWFQPRYADFVQRIKRLIWHCEDEKMNLALPQYVMFSRGLYRGMDCYTAYTYGDVFPYTDKQVDIPFDKMGEAEFRALSLHDYVSINYGNGFSQGDRFVAKQWPRENFEAVIRLLKQTYPWLTIVQMGTADAERLQGADSYVFGKDFEVVKHILHNAIFHLDIEGGLVHLASQMNVKCIVLFGPTQFSYFAYDNNINIQAGDCHGCYGLYRDISRCARGEKEPECMYKITPELVMSKITEYMEQMGYGRGDIH